MSQPGIDDSLADRIDDVDAGATGMQLVIVADGMFITGTAITFADFLASGGGDGEPIDATLTRMRASAKARVQRRKRLFDEFDARLDPGDIFSDDQQRQLDDLAPAYLHLQDVAVFVGDKRMNIPTLRIRLTAITSWTPGGIREDERDAPDAQ